MNLLHYATLGLSLILSSNALSINEVILSTKLKDRRTAISNIVAPPAFAFIASTCPQYANASSKDDLLQDLTTSKSKLEVIPSLLDQGEWDKVRTILKTPPVNQLWNLGDSQNTLIKLAKETGDIELLELKDELSISLQMCDQLTYDNAFVYFQPGNGKVNIKEPSMLAKKAMGQIGDAIDLISN